VVSRPGFGRYIEEMMMVVDSDDYGHEKRRSRRHPLYVPVFFEAGQGRTRDMSALGIYFETDAPVEIGPLRFSIALDTAAPDTSLVWCEGEVVRIEETPRGRGVAAQIDQIQFRA
jgi:hypothetical protein